MVSKCISLCSTCRKIFTDNYYKNGNKIEGNKLKCYFETKSIFNDLPHALLPPICTELTIM